MKLASTIALLSISIATAIAQKDTHDLAAAACSELSEAVMPQAANGHLAEAEALLARATVSGDQRGQDACAGMVLGRMAGITALLGRIAEAERLAEQSVRVLEDFYPQNDWVLLRPLQILAVARFASGKTTRAREALRRIRSIPIERPEDSAIVHGTVE